MMKRKKPELKDVTNHCVDSACLFDNIQKYIIESDYIDVRLNYTMSKFDMKVFLEHEKDLDILNIKIEEKQDAMLFSISLSKKKVNGHIEFFIPKCVEVSIKVKGGDVNVDSVASDDIIVCSTTGDVALHNVKAKAVKVKTREGDILIKTPPNLYKYDLATKNGDIQRPLAKKTASSKFVMRCESVDGDIVIVTT